MREWTEGIPARGAAEKELILEEKGRGRNVRAVNGLNRTGRYPESAQSEGFEKREKGAGYSLVSQDVLLLRGRGREGGPRGEDGEGRLRDGEGRGRWLFPRALRRG